jgi:cysteine desulfuration protein SufE
MTIKEIQDEIVEEFDFFSDWEQKYQYIIDLGKDLPPLPEQYRNEDHIVKGCQSQVWLHTDKENERLRFQADSDAFIVKGLVSMLMRVYDNQSPADILNTELTFIDQIGLGTALSPTRSNGLASMIKKIKTYAVAYSGNTAL